MKFRFENMDIFIKYAHVLELFIGLNGFSPASNFIYYDNNGLVLIVTSNKLDRLLIKSLRKYRTVSGEDYKYTIPKRDLERIDKLLSKR